MGKKLDLTGQRFGRLVVVRDSGEIKSGQGVIWECKCDCGKKSVVRSTNLRSGHIKSCGCLREEVTSKRMKTKCYHTKTIEAKKGSDLVEGTSLSSLTSKKYSNNTSGQKGVYWHKATKKWLSQIKIKGKTIHIGYYVDKQDAIDARLEAEEKYFKPILEKYDVKNTLEELEG